MTISNKANITDRASKGLPLTISEHDTNLDELRNVIDDASNNEQSLVDHIDDANPHPNYTPPVTSVHGRTGDVVSSSGDYDAVEIDFNPTGTNLVSTDVQNAVSELDQDLEDHEVSTTAHDASDIVYDNTVSGLVATNVQDAVDELEDEIDAKVSTDTVASLDGLHLNEDDSALGTGSVSLDVSAGNSFIINATGAVDITLTNAPLDKTTVVWIRGNNNGGSITFTTAVEWQTGTEPVLGTGYTVYQLVWIGGSWVGTEFTSA